MQLSSMQGESLGVDEPKAPLSIKLKTLDVSHSKTRSKVDRGKHGEAAGIVASQIISTVAVTRQ
jgi:hypothetical protein